MKKLNLITQTAEHYLRSGCELLLDGKHVIVTERTGDMVSLQCPTDHERRSFLFSTLDSYYTVGRLVPRLGSDALDKEALGAIERHSLISTCSPAAQKRLLEVKSWINALRGLGLPSLTPNAMLKNHMASLLATHKPKLTKIGPWTIFRQDKKLRDAGGNHEAIIPKYHQRGKAMVTETDPETGKVSQKRTVRLAHQVAEIVDVEIKKAIAVPGKVVRPFEVFAEVKKEIKKINESNGAGAKLILPAQMTIARWVHRDVPSYDMAVRRFGKGAADKMFRMTGARIRAERILECVQYDDTDTRVFLIDEETGLPWGTSYMTCGIDELTSALTGCQFGFEHRSIESALATVFHGIQRKDMTEPQYRLCTNAWGMHGRPGFALLDNASYNAAHAFHLTLMDLGMDYCFSRPHTPTDKSAVEFFNRQFKSKFAASLPGAAVKKSDRDASGRGMETAKLTLEEFKAKSMQWIVDEYLNTPNDSGWSPKQLWDQQADSVDLTVPEPQNIQFLKHTMVEKLKLRDSGGLLRNKLRYQSDEIEELQRRVGPRASLMVRVNFNSLESIYVHDHQADRWFKVPCIEDERYVKGLTNAQHKLIVKFRRDRKDEPSTSLQWAYDSKAELLKTASKLSVAKDLNSRGDGYRIRKTFEVSAPPTAKATAKAKTVPRSQVYEAQRIAPEMQPLTLGAPDTPVQTKVHHDYQRMLDLMKSCAH